MFNGTANFINKYVN